MRLTLDLCVQGGANILGSAHTNEDTTYGSGQVEDLLELQLLLDIAMRWAF